MSETGKLVVLIRGTPDRLGRCDEGTLIMETMHTPASFETRDAAQAQADAFQNAEVRTYLKTSFKGDGKGFGKFVFGEAVYQPSN
jgi:hypothetical protein